MRDQLNGKEYIRKLINIAYINIGIPLLFFIWVYLESNSGKLIPKIAPAYNMVVFSPILIVVLVLILIGYRKFRQRLNQSFATNLLAEKLSLYQKGITSRFLSYSISSLLISIAFYLTDFEPFTVLFGIMIVLFSIHSPNARRVANDLKLKNEDRVIILEGHDIPD